VLTLPIVFGGDIGLGVARGDGVEDVERADTLAGGEILRVEAAAAHVGDALRQSLGADTEPGEVTAPARHDDHIPALLRDCRRSDGRCCRYASRAHGTIG
jgi:hypothetical protein